MKRRRRSNAGFTLVELLLAAALTGSLALAVLTAYQSAFRLFKGGTSGLSMQNGTAATIVALRENLRSASCLTEPSAGQGGSALVGLWGVDCSKNPVEPWDSSGGGYFAFCVDSAARLRLLRGPGSAPPAGLDSQATCGTACAAPGADCVTLTPAGSNVQPIDSAIFNRAPAPSNRLDVGMSIAGNAGEAAQNVTLTAVVDNAYGMPLP